jgi:hypothetical protein
VFFVHKYYRGFWFLSYNKYVALWKSTRFNPLFEKYFLWNLKNRLHHQAGQTTGRVVHQSNKKLSCVVDAGVWSHTMSIAAFPLSFLACHRAYQLPTPKDGK